LNAEATLRAADARLLAPLPRRRVQLLGSLEGWAHALTRIGVELVDSDPDLVVATGRHAREAGQVGAPAVLVLAPRRAELRRAGYATRTVLVRGGPSAARLFVPVDARCAVRHALLAPVPGRPAFKRLAIRAAVAALRAGLPVGSAITLGTRAPQTPPIIAAALGSRLPDASDWYLVTGEGDDLQRLVWLCFDGGTEPEWVVKCSRVPGHEAPFVRDEQALASLSVLPDELRRRAPRLAARLQVDGLPVAVETAAPGLPLHVLLQHGGEHPPIVGRIADWVVEVAAATRLGAPELEPELQRLRGMQADIVDDLPRVPAVLQHNDLGCWNVLVRGDDFTVVDWESSRRAGLPLWDLVYYLADALTAGPDAGKADRVAALLRGEAAASAILFGRVRTAAERLDIPVAAVGPIVTLAWLHHAQSARHREQGPLQQVASYWLTDSALGPGWSAFAARRDG
jgi:hypothetical protein